MFANLQHSWPVHILPTLFHFGDYIMQEFSRRKQATGLTAVAVLRLGEQHLMWWSETQELVQAASHCRVFAISPHFACFFSKLPQNSNFLVALHHKQCHA